MKKYAFYCSGNATRVINFYLKYPIQRYQCEFVVYDGTNSETVAVLENIFGKESILSYSHDSNLTRKENNVQFSDYLLAELQKKEVDYLFCFGNGILKGNLLAIYRNKIINFHPSLLPSFPGLNAIDQALKSSVKLLGNTAHFIDEGIDTGPIIMQTVIARDAFRHYDDVLDLQTDMLKTIWELLDQNLIDIENNSVRINGAKTFSNNHYSSI